MRRPLQAGLFCVVLLWALALRVWRLDEVALRVDEAESTINALTVLQHGLPVDHYLGLPIYENTLTLPWPESPEYEFRDSSYSRRGLAIYHGWLPLYSIAASLRAFGIAPDVPASPPTVRRTPEDMVRLNVAARAPSVLFGGLLLLVVFVTANELFGRDAAWGALLAASFSWGFVDLAREARYYALAVLLSTACCLLVWRVHRRGSWKHWWLAALAFALLFHTHVVAFLIASAVLALVLPAAMGQPGLLHRALAFGVVVLSATLPWLWLTGFLERAAGIPMAWPLLCFPDDLLAFLQRRPPVSLLVVGGGLLFVAADVGERRLPPWFSTPFLAHRDAFRYLIAWLLVSYLVFTLLVPAVSYSLERLALPMMGPGLVLVAGLVAAGVRLFADRSPLLLPALLLAVYLAFFGHFNPLGFEPARPPYKRETVEFLRDYPLRPDTRLYATPNFHFVITVYTGLPVQSVAPVRKSFLDTHPGEILVFEVIPFRSPPAGAVRRAAEAAGVRLDDAEAQRLAWLVTSRAVYEALRERVAEVDVPPGTEDLPPYLRPLIEDQPRYTEEFFRERSTSVKAFPAVFRGFSVRDWATWWPVYFYRFVQPAVRMGPHLNYAERVRSGRATVLASGLTVFQSPSPVARGDAAEAGTGQAP